MTPTAIEYLLPHMPNGAPPAEGPDTFFLCEVACGDHGPGGQLTIPLNTPAP